MRRLQLLFLARVVAGQFGFSLAPALESLESIILGPGPTKATPHAVTPTPRTSFVQTTFAAPSPTEATLAPPIQTSIQTTPILTFSTSHTSQSTSKTHQDPIVHTTSQHTTSHETSKLAEAAATATSTKAATSGGSGGLSQGAKIGIGVTIGLLVFLGLLAALFYSLHTSGAYANWREKRMRNKHERIPSFGAADASFRGPTLPTVASSEKDTASSHISEFGNGTLLGRPAALQRDGSLDYSDYDRSRALGPLAVVNLSTPDAEKEDPIEAQADHSEAPTAAASAFAKGRNERASLRMSHILEREVPPPPIVYHQARQIDVRIKRKAVPGQTFPQRQPGPPRQAPRAMQNVPRTPAFWIEDRY